MMEGSDLCATIEFGTAGLLSKISPTAIATADVVRMSEI
jgi:hypothetical protein